MGAVMAVLRHTGKVAGGAVSAVLVARSGLPGLVALVFLAILVIGVACWILLSDARADRVSRVLLAWRGDVGCLARDGAVPPSAPAAQPRRRLLPRRS
jgi:hypothetical protein